MYHKTGIALALEQYKNTVSGCLTGTSLTKALSYQYFEENSVHMCLCTEYVSMYECVYMVMHYPRVL